MLLFDNKKNKSVSTCKDQVVTSAEQDQSRQTSFHFIDWQPAKVTSSCQSATSLYMVIKKKMYSIVGRMPSHNWMQLEKMGIYKKKTKKTFTNSKAIKLSLVAQEERKLQLEQTFTHLHLPLLDVFWWSAASPCKNLGVTLCRREEMKPPKFIRMNFLSISVWYRRHFQPLGKSAIILIAGPYE